ncbi:fanconi anemia group A protein [Pelomyxa schiedti]|nr:fanconi anemia group A protein [Pelomyxa schiedti]
MTAALAERLADMLVSADLGVNRGCENRFNFKAFVERIKTGPVTNIVAMTQLHLCSLIPICDSLEALGASHNAGMGQVPLDPAELLSSQLRDMCSHQCAFFHAPLSLLVSITCTENNFSSAAKSLAKDVISRITVPSLSQPTSSDDALTTNLISAIFCTITKYMDTFVSIEADSSEMSSLETLVALANSLSVSLSDISSTFQLLSEHFVSFWGAQHVLETVFKAIQHHSPNWMGICSLLVCIKRKPVDENCGEASATASSQSRLVSFVKELLSISEPYMMDVGLILARLVPNDCEISVSTDNMTSTFYHKILHDVFDTKRSSLSVHRNNILQQLITLIPFEDAHFIKLHLSLFSKYTTQSFRNYCELAKSKLHTLESESSLDTTFSEDKSAAQDEVDIATDYFVDSEKIPHSIQQWWIDNRKWFEQEFTVALMKPSPDPLRNANRRKFINALETGTMIPKGSVSNFIRSCSLVLGKDSGKTSVDSLLNFYLDCTEKAPNELPAIAQKVEATLLDVAAQCDNKPEWMNEGTAECSSKNETHLLQGIERVLNCTCFCLAVEVQQSDFSNLYFSLEQNNKWRGSHMARILVQQNLVTYTMKYIHKLSCSEQVVSQMNSLNLHCISLILLNIEKSRTESLHNLLLEMHINSDSSLAFLARLCASLLCASYSKNKGGSGPPGDDIPSLVPQLLWWSWQRIHCYKLPPEPVAEAQRHLSNLLSNDSMRTLILSYGYLPLDTWLHYECELSVMPLG